MAAYQNLVTAEDTARIAYSDQIKQNPAAAAQFTRDTTASLKAGIMSAKQNAYAQVEQELSRAQDETANVKLYQTRTSDTDDLATQIERNNQAVAGQLADDKAMTKRQFEINEWYNYDKLETLFFLQIVFMVSLSVAIVMYWSKQGLITAGFAGILYGILGLIVIGVGVHKYFYTEKTRDVKLWHRRRFASAPPPPPPICGPSNDLLGEAEKLLKQGENAVQNCANNIDSGLSGINAAAVAEVAGIENGRLNLLEQLGTSVCGAIA